MAQSNQRLYGIRTSLAKSIFDVQIQLGGNVSLSFAKRPITLATFIYVMVAIFGYAIIYSDTVVHYGGPFGIGLFTAGYIGTYVALLTRTRTLNYKVSYIPVIFSYWRRGGRYVKTGLLDPGGPLKNFLGIDPVHGIDKTGLVHFNNGEVGIFFDVVGNASSMIFEADQEQVINDARTVYKNLPSMCGLTLITQASNQDVHIQLQSKLDQLHRLQIDSPGLRQIVKKQGQVLRDTVGNNFSMIRQYLFVRGSADNVKIVAKSLYQGANSATNTYLKSAKQLTNEPKRIGADGLPLNEPYQVEKLLRTIFNDYQNWKPEDENY